MLTIIGDVHGKHDDYLKIVDNSKYTLQVGDFGLDWSVLELVNNKENKIIGGNHDNYDTINQYLHYLGDFGTTNFGGTEFFFVRGERSVDAHLRIEGKSWWRNEELDINTAYQAVSAYETNKPDIVISHGCPESVLPLFVTNSTKYKASRTAQLLNAMLDIHRPKLWIFGHHHNSKSIVVNGCNFICLNELETINI